MATRPAAPVTSAARAAPVVFEQANVPAAGHAPVEHLLYLHGFRSSPRSAKALRTARAVQALQASGRAIEWRCPQLPASPAESMARIRELTREWPAARSAVIGSSLGGFYATVLCEERGLRAVLLNPAVDPARDLAAQIGDQAAWHEPALRFRFTAAHVDELRALRPAAIADPQRYHAVIATGDEVLDWREMSARYAGAQGTRIEGGDHALSEHFESELPRILRFLGLSR